MGGQAKLPVHKKPWQPTVKHAGVCCLPWIAVSPTWLRGPLFQVQNKPDCQQTGWSGPMPASPPPHLPCTCRSQGRPARQAGGGTGAGAERGQPRGGRRPPRCVSHQVRTSLHVRAHRQPGRWAAWSMVRFCYHLRERSCGCGSRLAFRGAVPVATTGPEATTGPVATPALWQAPALCCTGAQHELLHRHAHAHTPHTQRARTLMHARCGVCAPLRRLSGG